MTHAPWHSGGGGTFTGAHPSYSPPEPPAPAPAPPNTPPPGQPSSGPHIGYGENQVNIGTQTEPNQVNVGYGEGQVDPGLAAAVLTQNNPEITPQEANQIVQSGMGSTGVGFGIGSLPPVAATTTDGVVPTDGVVTTDDVPEEAGLPEIIKNIFTGPQIQRLTPSQLRRVEQILAHYQRLGITNPLKLRTLMASNIGGALFGKNQEFSDMEGNIVDEEDIVFKDGEMFTKDGKPVRRTKEGTINLLEEEGSGIMKSLQKFNPELYYPFQGMPQTSGGLEDLANLQVTEEMQGVNPELAQMIFDARQELDRRKDRHGGGGQGIADLAPMAQLAATTTPEEVAAETVPVEAEVPAEEVAVATTTVPGTTTTSTPYSQWPQYQGYPTYGPAGGPIPDYVNQGLGQAPNFDYFTQVAQAFPGMRNYAGMS